MTNRENGPPGPRTLVPISVTEWRPAVPFYGKLVGWVTVRYGDLNLFNISIHLIDGRLIVAPNRSIEPTGPNSYEKRPDGSPLWRQCIGFRTRAVRDVFSDTVIAAWAAAFPEAVPPGFPGGWQS